ncbi:SURF1 family cytochrome oxidase biogenesis protein [Gulosibacter chungangensis]|uniref:SURF1-like protein n=1 Tax=Gulosibacter chungangensis TaxID=979746 RepID=A0A7J5B887_9MICO|nr:SURF1 family protein [Gulosibacter chungangensis]KAB1641427.1 SURF1 family protein [Gulosibacter chungangensis]
MTTQTVTSEQGPSLAGEDYPYESPQTQPGWSFLRSRRWLGYYVLLILFCIVCVWLADWQFDRRADARAEIARIDQNYDAPAIPLEEAVPDPTSFDENALKWQTATVRGEYFGEPFLARNRPGPEGVGSQLLQALRTEQGPVFIVDRGWVPVNGNEANAGDAWLDRVPPPPAGLVEVDVRLRASEPQVVGRLSHGSTVASINLPELARVGGFDEAYTGAYGMLIRETPDAATGVLPEPPERDEGPHLSYALQWYVFILIAAFGIVYAARQEHRGLNAGSEAVLRQDRRAAVRKARRGTTDAEEEDALLDN